MREMQKHKQAIRTFLKLSMGDEELAMTLAHAQSGRLAFYSCCCLIGMATIREAAHAPRPELLSPIFSESHYNLARTLAGALEAEAAFRSIVSDGKRRRVLIPILRAEIKRRDLEKKAQEVVAQELVVA